MSDLTPEEQAHVRIAMRVLRARCGSWELLAKALGFGHGALTNVSSSIRPVSARLAIRVARLAKVGIDDLLAGKFPPPGTCLHCGHRAEDPAT